MQINTIFVWLCTGTFCLFYIELPTLTNPSLKWCYCVSLLGQAFLLDPLSIFIYTWTFLNVAIPDFEGSIQRTIRIYQVVSIYTLPLITYALYVSTGLAYGYIDYFKFQDLMTDKMSRVGVILYASLAAWDCLLILLSCVHLALLLRSVFKLKQKIN